MKALLSSVLIAVIMLSGFSSVFAADDKNHATCKRCRLSSTTITILCDGPVKNARVRLNCVSTGWLSQQCYEWRGQLDSGENPIPLTRFTSEEGRRFNPVEYAVKKLNIGSTSDVWESSYFNWDKD